MNDSPDDATIPVHRPKPGPPELQGLDPMQLLKGSLDTVRSEPGSAPWQPPSPEELTALLPKGDYSVESFLGMGGMGSVYKGTQVRLKRPVAIKIMRRDQGRDHDFEQRFQREALAMAKLNHPNIVAVIDYGEAGPDYLYIVMELVDGADLMDVIRTGRMTQEMALTLLPQICDALQFAHDHGIVHRDIKPSNIMLTRDGRIKMADFGLAKHHDAESSFRTQTGTGMGTPDYAAPEQFDPTAQIDHRADIYALGVMIYQMITGQLPRGIWKAPSQRAQVDTQWDEIFRHAMESDPADRYHKASEIKTDVSHITSPGAAATSSPGAPPFRAASSRLPQRGAKQSEAPEGGAPGKRIRMIAGLITGALVLGVSALFLSRNGPKSAEVGSSFTATNISAGIEPKTAIKLWQKPESLQPGNDVRWQEGVVQIAHGSLQYADMPSRDAILRASVRMNPDAVAPQISLLKVGGSQCGLRVNAATNSVVLDVIQNGNNKEQK